AYQWPNRNGYSYSLPDITTDGNPTSRVCVSLYVNKGKVDVRILPRAILLPDVGMDRLHGWLGSKMHTLKDGTASLHVTSEASFEAMRPAFEAMCSAISEGWRLRREAEQAALADSTSDGHAGASV
ncbi:MAG: hypothetical protein AB7D57_11185, partial [Desulfovibrionaceae bacterium]